MARRTHSGIPPMFIRLRSLLRSARKNTDGQELIEYGILAALIAAVVVLVLSQVGTRVFDIFQSTDSALGGGASNPNSGGGGSGPCLLYTSDAADE